jgi:hypothetical protein
VRPVSTSGQLADALTPQKLRRDGIRLGLLAIVSIVYSLVLEQPILDVLLIALNGLGMLVGTLAVVVSAFAVRRHSRPALIALAAYGACLAGHLTAIVLLLRA